MLSHLLSDSSSFGDKVSPILHIHLLESFPFKHLLRFRIFLCLHCLVVLVLLLTLHGIRIFFLSKLLESLSWHVMARSEHLIFVLRSNINPAVDCALVNNYTLFRLLISFHDSASIVKIIVIQVLRSHEIWHII